MTPYSHEQVASFLPNRYSAEIQSISDDGSIIVRASCTTKEEAIDFLRQFDAAAKVCHAFFINTCNASECTKEEEEEEEEEEELNLN